ncbi:hypothetical protein KXX21_005120 [Aspergillus fumigatus]|nr:hypothetical protein KXX21_005120 [Aspergillus fumigatus]KMK56453.1 hypothetical protein Y699_05368 [Aspergillus fumigatus Z5]
MYREIANSPFDYDDDPQPPAIDPWVDNSQYAPTPGNFGHSSDTPCSLSPSPHRTLQPHQASQLGFLPLAEWEEGGEYDEQPPRYVRYTIEWKLTLNTKKVGSVTEKDLVVAPSDYWEEFLKADLENMLQTKRKRHQRVRSEGTAITVSVNDRTQSPLKKFCSSTNINWTPVEKQLRKWSNLLRIGKRLKVTIAFNYRQDDDGTPGRGDKRSRVSATRRMLAEREAQIDAEEERTGRPSSWNHVYGLMRCKVRSCPLKSEWYKKHYKLRAPHLGRLVDYVDDGGNLESHDDIPNDIRRDLVLESQAGKKTRKANNAPATGVPYTPISINVLPAQTTRASAVAELPARHSPPDQHPVIPGPREEAVRKYCRWLESRATDEAYKADFRRICKVTLENHLDLELILEDPDPGFFVKQGIKTGTARRFVRDIHEWAKCLNTNMALEESAWEVLNDVIE